MEADPGDRVPGGRQVDRDAGTIYRDTILFDSTCTCKSTCTVTPLAFAFASTTTSMPPRAWCGVWCWRWLWLLGLFLVSVCVCGASSSFSPRRRASSTPYFTPPHFITATHVGVWCCCGSVSLPGLSACRCLAHAAAGGGARDQACCIHLLKQQRSFPASAPAPSPRLLPSIYLWRFLLLLPYLMFLLPLPVRSHRQTTTYSYPLSSPSAF